MGILSGLGDMLSSAWDTTKRAADYVGLDGSFGYQGSFASPTQYSGLSQWNIPQVGSYGQNVGHALGVDDGSVLGGLGATLSRLGTDLNSWYNGTTSQDWKNYAQIGQGLGSIGLGYLQYKQNKDLHDAQKQAMDYSLQQQQDADRRRKLNSQNMQTGFDNSGLGSYLTTY